MSIDRSSVAAVGSAVLVAVATYPLMGFGSILLGATAFFVVAFTLSGYGVGRSVAWGVVVAALVIAGRLGPHSLAQLFYLLGGVLFFAGVLSPTFRRWWFARPIG